MRPLEDARRDVLAAVPRVDRTTVDLDDALGLVLADDVATPHDLPPFTNSAMDGYAVRAEDVAQAPVTLSVSEDVAAGYVAAATVEPGTAIKIMTGAPLPEGADTVVKVEDTEPGERSVLILRGAAKGTAVRTVGSDVARGDVVVNGGRRLTPAMLGVLSSVGVVRPTVSRKLRVAVMSTGDEVVPTGTLELAPGKIRDANRPTLKALLTELGVEIVDVGIIGDDADTLRAAVADAASTCDAVLTSGGVSMGEYDLVKQVLGELGTIEFWQVAMQPGKPFAFGLVEGTPLFGLPGNPVSVTVAFEQFVRPALLTMMDATHILRPRLGAVLLDDVRTDPAKTVFLRGVSDHSADGWTVRLSGGQESNMLSAVAAGDCFIVVPRGVSTVAALEKVTIEMFRWPEDRAYEEGKA